MKEEMTFCVCRWAPAQTNLPATANSTWLLCHYTATTKIKERLRVRKIPKGVLRKEITFKVFL